DLAGVEVPRRESLDARQHAGLDRQHLQAFFGVEALLDRVAINDRAEANAGRDVEMRALQRRCGARDEDRRRGDDENRAAHQKPSFPTAANAVLSAGLSAGLAETSR